MKLCIDPGHGMSNAKPNVFDPGAVAEGGQFAEADFTLKFGLTLKQLCVESVGSVGQDVAFFLTRASSAEPAPVGKRAARAAAAGCTHFVSFHLNSGGPTASGLEVLYRKDAKDKPLAERMQARLIAVTGLRDRGIKQRDDLAVLKFAPGPAVLIELGFITNKKDRDFLNDRDHRIAICRAVFDVVT